MLHCIDSHSVELVFTDKPFDPVLVQRSNTRVLGVNIRQVGNLAVLYSVLLGVVDSALGMEGRLLVQRLWAVIGYSTLAHVVCYHVDHDIDALQYQ